MKRWALTVAGLVLLAAACWAAFDWYRAREADMSERPPLQATAATLEPQESVVLANLSLGYPVIAQALNQQADKLSGSKSDSSEIKCVRNDFPSFKECLTVRWKVNYSRDGNIAVGHDGSMVKISVPGKFDGTGWIRRRDRKDSRPRCEEFRRLVRRVGDRIGKPR